MVILHTKKKGEKKGGKKGIAMNREGMAMNKVQNQLRIIRIKQK